ncbi:SDR family NAD(P)-dependent oxidoreductase [Alkalihalobacterium elongatum]|uniref:SDR family NAD(P)-dependent oxidoreductase n=1 Tax=Alkalihalobacterium elongatum TaxID=2675466 RepID=UPI001C1FC11F|nr:SDR family oxidoreductase [Alkalihalobacterium elongatum]
MSNWDFSGKTVVITGGSRGIGAQLAHDFAEYGANIVIVGRNLEKAEEVVQEISKHQGRHLAVSCDVSKIEDINRLFDTVEKEYKSLDVLINGAGVNVTKPAVEVTENEWDYILDINLKGLFFCCQRAAKTMMSQNKGKIINISSTGGIKPLQVVAPYMSSKAAVIHLTKGLALEWSRYNIFVNAIAPGLIPTEINAEDFKNTKWVEKSIKGIPLRRLGHPEDLSSISLYLASEQSNYVTGQTFVIDGGFSIK